MALCASFRFIHLVQEMSKYRSKGDLGARTDLERDNTEHILDQQSRVRVRGQTEQPQVSKDGQIPGSDAQDAFHTPVASSKLQLGELPVLMLAP